MFDAGKGPHNNEDTEEGATVYIDQYRPHLAGDIALKLGQGQYVKIYHRAEGIEVSVANMTREELIKLLAKMGVGVL